MRNSSTRNRFRAFTLLEVLITTAVTLLLMLGLAQIFRVLGDSITKGRATLELNNRLRNVMHRIRTDINNITVIPNPPLTAGSAQGYLKIYDGPGSDVTPLSLDPTNPMRLSRFGDVDDILMCTIKAKGPWFTGKVPSFVLNGTQPTGPSDLLNLVTISSQYAELIIFAEPTPTQRRYSSTSEPTVENVYRDPIRLAADPLDGFEDLFLGADGFPDGFKLHYRLLLIRPDLNLPQGHLGGLNDANPMNRVLVAGPEWLTPEFQVQPPSTANLIVPEANGSQIILPSPMCDMWRIHQYCDLSVRRVFNDADSLPGSHDYVAANGLEDLTNPRNRFAHFQLPLSADHVSVPILALAQPLIFQQNAMTLAGITPVNFAQINAGFLHPVFTLLGQRAGEDVLTNDLLAFDAKVFDSSAPIYINRGLDNLPPDPLSDIANANLLGAVGSDDFLVRPGDPGYKTYGVDVVGLNSLTRAHGEFVDVNWGAKAELPNLESEFSGRKSGQISPALWKSGLVKFSNSTNSFVVFQPSFDTFTDAFERDRIFQAFIDGLGTAAWVGGGPLPAVSPPDAWRTMIDAGTDAIDNDSNGLVDDARELETSAPFMTNLKGIQITIRIEDRPTRQFTQMSAVKSFVVPTN